MIEPSQARYRHAHALHRLANALGVQLLPEHEDCVCLERLATVAERLIGLQDEDPRSHADQMEGVE